MCFGDALVVTGRAGTLRADEVSHDALPVVMLEGRVPGLVTAESRASATIFRGLEPLATDPSNAPGIDADRSLEIVEDAERLWAVRPPGARVPIASARAWASGRGTRALPMGDGRVGETAQDEDLLADGRERFEDR